MLNLPEYNWEEIKITGDYKVQDLTILYNRLDEKTLENNPEEIQNKNFVKYKNK